MSEWALKRFWEKVAIEPSENGFRVVLDGRPVRTPAKSVLIVPSEAIGRAIAAEWEAQVEIVDPTSMPWTRSANAALDKVATQRDEVIDHLASYAGTDLLCYRASDPESLIKRQAKMWDPLLDWAKSRYSVSFQVTSGVMPILQPEETLGRLREEMLEMTDFQLTGFHDLVTLSGSYVLALAVAERVGEAGDLWPVSRLDEDWQAEQWGKDEEAEEHAEIKRQAFEHAANIYHFA